MAKKQEEQADTPPISFKHIRPIIAWRADYADYFFGLIGETEDGGRYEFTLVPEKTSRHGVISPALNLLHSGFLPVQPLLQAIVDEAYSAGIRPSPEVADSDAKTKHLDDMRKMTFQLLDNVTKPSD